MLTYPPSSATEPANSITFPLIGDRPVSAVVILNHIKDLETVCPVMPP